MTDKLTKEMDVNLLGDETPEQLVELMNGRLQAEVRLSDTQHNSAVTVLVTGTRPQLLAAYAWRETAGSKRPDLVGKPPVGKGEQR